MLKMNYSDFKNKTTIQIIKEADRRGIVRRNVNPANVSRNDLIGRIIAHDAYYEGKEDGRRELGNDKHYPYNQPHSCTRKEYTLNNDGNILYLKLTKEQVDFFHYLEEHGIDIGNDYLEEFSGTKFEAP